MSGTEATVVIRRATGAQEMTRDDRPAGTVGWAPRRCPRGTVLAEDGGVTMAESEKVTAVRVSVLTAG